MGRLFQYNRFLSGDDKMDNISRSTTNQKSKTDQIVKRCPAYSELYPEYNEDTTSATTATLLPSLITVATTTSAPTKRMELAIKKYQQWSSKFLPIITTTTATSTTANSLSDNKQTLPIASPSYFTTPTTTTTTTTAAAAVATITTSGYQNLENDKELLVNAVKKPKVYDYMKEFLRRKFFQQHLKEDEVAIKQQQTELDEDITSDYDEIDILDSSYNADEEDSTDCCSNCTYLLEDEDVESSSSNDEFTVPLTIKKSKEKFNCPQKSLLSLSCWQSNQNYPDSTTEEEHEEAEVETATEAEDSDAGISDCRQLVNEKVSPKRHEIPKKITRKIKKKKQQQIKYRYNIDNAELSELLESSWYQPRITTKAVLERLQQEKPGSFLVRRKSRNYELCLRGVNKVKCYSVINCADYYKLKGARKQFTSLKALVTHHSVMAEQLPLTLILPREKRNVRLLSQRYSDDFDSYESLQILGVLKNLQAKTFEL